VLFSTLVATALSLLGGQGMRFSLGITLLGLAAAWAIGSDMVAREWRFWSHAVASPWRTVSGVWSKVDDRAKDRIAYVVCIFLILVGLGALLVHIGITLAAFGLILVIWRKSRAWDRGG